MRVNAIAISFIILLLGNSSYSQELWDVQLRFLKSIQRPEQLFPNESLKVDTLKIPGLISQRLSQLYELGHLSANYKIKRIDSSKIQIDFYGGEIFKMVALGQGNVSDEIMNKIGFRPLHYQNKPFSIQRLMRLLNSILDYAENSGFPFASAKLDSIQFGKQGLSATINYRSGPSITFDSLYITGYNKVKPKYLMTHLGIYKGKPYEEKLILEIPNKLNLLPFISLTEEPEITIREGVCSIGLNLQQEKVSQIDGVIGVLPNQKEGEKLLITGQVMLDLRNLFSSGKRLAFDWQSFDSNSQLLDILYFHPNLFKTPINIQGGFNLLKQDTTFLNRSLNLELSILTKNSSKIGFITDFFTSRIISTLGLENETELPENNDFNLNYYGINYQQVRFNNAIQPSRGWAFDFSGSAGQKKIITNPALNDEVYDSLELNSLQMKFGGSFDKYWPLNNFLVFRSRLIGGYIHGDNLFPGDLYRLGGLKTLRGFGEKSFYASSYGLLNLEMRAYLASDTYFMLFFDQSMINNESTQGSERQYPFGTGIGFSFDTDAGIFNFALALGKSNTQPFAFNYSKIHFGYIGKF